MIMIIINPFTVFPSLITFSLITTREYVGCCKVNKNYNDILKETAEILETHEQK